MRESQRRVDPEGSMLRRLCAIQRRVYKVAAPRSLYHMDGNHKLIRYMGKEPVNNQIIMMLQDVIAHFK